MYRFVKRMIAATLTLVICGFASAQTQPPAMPDIQKLTNNAMKLSIGIGAASAGVAVIGFLIKHHNHRKSSDAFSSAKGRPGAGLSTAPLSSVAPADPHAALQTPCPSANQSDTSTARFSTTAAEKPREQSWSRDMVGKGCPAT